ncbi:hypothetical protein QR680_013097 [Steinernema hermaphroditum]|uniref:THO complex subunit 2 n=1 Tax=Steinernema hermaphroditum TaxID=289476 RepID=A0AA39I6E0_9BILA|nr:hypothetical protein QR680_013097 [Steinernema hermaphroditum]
MTDAIPSSSSSPRAEAADPPSITNGDASGDPPEGEQAVGRCQLLKVFRDFMAASIEKESALKQAFEISQQNTEAFLKLLPEVLMVIEAEVKEDNKDRFIDMVKIIGSLQVIPEDVLKVDLPTYGDIDGTAVGNAKSRYNKTRTRLYYKQTKFNLFHEENEGFAKLIVELLDQSYQQSTAEELSNRLQLLIGQFKVDPNRVANFVLDAFENCLDRREVFVALLKSFEIIPENLIHHIAVKLRFYAKNGETPFPLYLLIAVLIDEELVDLEAILPHMTMNSAKLKADGKDRMERTKKRAKKAETISTATVQLSGDRDKNMDAMTNDDSKAGIPMSVATAIQENQDAKLAMDDNDDIKTLGKNQKLGLLCALLEVRNWPRASYLLDRFPEYYPVNVSVRVAKALSSVLHDAIVDFYDSKYVPEWSLPSSSTQVASCDSDESCPPVRRKCFEVNSWSELVENLTPIYHNLGPYVAHRPDVVYMLVRLFEIFFRDRKNDEVLCESTHTDALAEKIIDIIDEVVLPSLSLSDYNCAISEEIWSLLSLLDYKHRYRMYGRWNTVHSLRFHGISIKKGKVLGKTRYVLKRLSKDTVRVMGRQLGKLCHSHPLVVFDYILGQVQTFENLIEPVVDSLKYLSSLEFDILSYSIIRSLSEEGKEQLKESDGTFSPWLQALATFVGNVFKRYNIELSGLLFYVLNQLRDKQSYDLIVLREVMHSMSGIEVGTHLADEQLDALCGGENLRAESGSMTNVKMNRRAVVRLRDTLSKDDLLTALCIMIAQQSNWIVFHESEEIPVKLTGVMLDKCQETLIQCGSFLWSNSLKTPSMPLAPELISKYDLSPEAAFFLTRLYYIRQITVKFECSRDQLVETKGDESEPLANVDMEYILYKAAFDEVVNELSEQLYEIFPEGFFDDLTAKVYVTFWLLSSSDITVPKKAYEREIEKVKKEIETLCQNSDMKREKNQKEEKRLKDLQQSLELELEEQTVHVNRIKNILKSSKGELFALKSSACSTSSANQMPRFMQACVLPRAVCTEIDAMYCAMFIELLQTQGTAFFQTVVFFNKLVPDVFLILANLSENEANCYGKFLCCLTEVIKRWRDEAVFEKEIHGSPGMCTRWKGFDQINYECFKTITENIFMRFSRSACNAISSDNYTLIRNALFVLTKMLPVFPFAMFHHNLIVERVQKLKERESDSRRDLSLMAASYAGQLKKHVVKNIPNFEEQLKQKAQVKDTAVKELKTVTKRSASNTPEEDAQKKESVKENGSALKKPRMEASNECLSSKGSSSSEKTKTTGEKSKQDEPTVSEEKKRKEKSSADMPPPPVPEKKRIESSSSGRPVVEKPKEREGEVRKEKDSAASTTASSGPPKKSVTKSASEEQMKQKAQPKESNKESKESKVYPTKRRASPALEGEPKKKDNSKENGSTLKKPRVEGSSESSSSSKGSSSEKAKSANEKRKPEEATISDDKKKKISPPPEKKRSESSSSNRRVPEKSDKKPVSSKSSSDIEKEREKAKDKQKEASPKREKDKVRKERRHSYERNERRLNRR